MGLTSANHSGCYVSHDGGEQDRSGRHFTGLVCTQGSQFIRYLTLDAAGNPITLPNFALTYIDASNGPDLPAVGGVEAASLRCLPDATDHSPLGMGRE